MANRPKAIGTAAETAVLKQILPYFPTAERLSLKGANDEGDIGHCGEFIFEVKGGKQTHQIGDGLLAKWMDEALTEARNRGVGYGVLVVQRKGVGAPNARRWWVYVTGGDLADIMGGVWIPASFVPIRLELGDFLDLLGDQGFTPTNVEPAHDVVLAVPAFAIEAPADAPVVVESIPLVDAMLERETTDTGRMAVLAEYVGLPDDKETDAAAQG